MAREDFYCLHSDLCKTLANAKRQQILDFMREREMPVGDIARETGISQANVSQHLALLRSKGIVKVRRQGSHAYYSISNLKILKAFDLISEVLSESLDTQNETVSSAMSRRPTKEVARHGS
jgi:ArsR family transcriptional regulator, virulence genes transcriptional regulator